MDLSAWTIPTLIGLAVAALALVRAEVIARSSTRAARVAEQKAEEWRAKVRRLTWLDFRNAARVLVDQARADMGGDPDFLVALSPRGGVLAQLIQSEVGHQIPIVVCVNHFIKDDGEPFPEFPGDWEEASNGRCRVLVPKALLSIDADRVLLVDDWANTGKMLADVYSILCKQGRFKNIRTATVARTETAWTRNEQSQLKAFSVEAEGLTMPWGLAQ